MNVIDLLITIVVVTILVTIVLAVITYVAYKLRLARQPAEDAAAEDELRYFVKYEPSMLDAEPKGHAPET
jgi:heme/copper-type cytochrome/quinol oxidase subunit 2